MHQLRHGEAEVAQRVLDLQQFTGLSWVHEAVGSGHLQGELHPFASEDGGQWGGPETGAPPFQGFPQHSTRIVAPGLPVLQTSTWSGGVLAPNGKVYMVPNSHSSVLIYDPRTGAVDLSSISGLGDAPAKWLGGVVAGNGRIYCPPDSAGTVLVIDSRRNSTHQLPVPQPGGWAGAVLGVDGRIYCVPMQGNPQSSPPWLASVLVIDPATETVSTIATDLTALDDDWFGGVLAPDGRIYCIPRKASAILVIDTTTNPATISSLAKPAVSGEWSGGVLAPNGVVYGIPRTATAVLRIAPAADRSQPAAVSTIGTLAGGTKWNGGVLAANGLIYGIPFASNEVLVIDPRTEQISTFPAGTSGSLLKWWGGVLTPGGEIVGVPFRQDGILAIRTGLPQLPGWMLEPQFNKF